MISRRTADTMSDAIALSSPSGRMSKRAREAAQRRLAVALFGPNGEAFKPAEPTERERIEAKATALERSAANLRALAERGMKVRAYPKQAARMETEAAALRASINQTKEHE